MKILFSADVLQVGQNIIIINFTEHAQSLTRLQVESKSKNNALNFSAINFGSALYYMQ